MSEIEELYKDVDDIYTRDEFEQTIEKRREEYNGLFTDEVIAKLLLAEEDRYEVSQHDIEELEAGQEATVEGRIIDLGSVRTFSKKNGQGKVRNVRIDDGTGSLKVVFWGDKAEEVDERFETGDEIKVINGYVQDKGYGLQISGGKWGTVRNTSKND